MNEEHLDELRIPTFIYDHELQILAEWRREFGFPPRSAPMAMAIIPGLGPMSRPNLASRSVWRMLHLLSMARSCCQKNFVAGGLFCKHFNLLPSSIDSLIAVFIVVMNSVRQNSVGSVLLNLITVLITSTLPNRCAEIFGADQYAGGSWFSRSSAWHCGAIFDDGRSSLTSFVAVWGSWMQLGTDVVFHPTAD